MFYPGFKTLQQKKSKTKNKVLKEMDAHVINLRVTVAQKTAPMFAYYIKTHVLLNADII